MRAGIVASAPRRREAGVGGVTGSGLAWPRSDGGAAAPCEGVTVLAAPRRGGDAASPPGRRDGEAAASLQQLSSRAAASPLQRGVSRQVGSGADGARMAALWAPLLFRRWGDKCFDVA